MRVLQKLRLLFFIASRVSMMLLLPHVSSSTENMEAIGGHSSSKDNSIKMNPRLVFEISLHGFLLWASMGFLMPVGILAIRLSNNGGANQRRFRMIFYVHAILQKVAVIVATVGAIMSIKNFNNAFNNNHQRVGVALYGIIWLQALLGIFRPRRGSKRRSVWFFLHWILGTVISFLGILNVYIGLQAYQEKTSKSIRIWNILFTIQLVIIMFFYLLQDKWVYLQKKQGVILDNECQEISSDIKQKEMKAESC
ncbi:cytochrome b561 domain-containing protein At2g30890-like [Prosopis cineraria]|uniref:cytochrome b561 domain-containing protein At2g30890-like n=1 Tax=Prosopis cineraria TaxID=364024 RepID=UPI00240EAA3B|nr:cytochrome b561 domain-containing protein At2g30890-like [Prosopis cineraria]XP_054799838.1 cytochrome b561 domain-containing protein At2g30890-like [Prosopis cineraria]XP_054799839.1 cytochrome b561 domain-containing protein At2g30890-like [Prosopis cineraria]XP_054799840.1 cytochrome b561 domain-containing protein At2g30890-like [Prosopis cineraria]